MKTTLDYARFWIDSGVTPIPVKYKTKIPLVKWGNWNTRLPSMDLVNGWFDAKYKRNIGLCCGMNGLVVVDFDDMDYYRSWYDSIKRTWQKIFDSTYRVITSRGIHFYFKVREKENNQKLKCGVDIKSERSFVLSPPSVHPGGAIYTGNLSRIITISSLKELFPYVETEKQQPKEHVKDSVWNVADEDQSYSIKFIKSKISILDLLFDYTKLARNSSDGRWWMGRCPDHAHKDVHPSFRADTVNDRCTCLSGRCNLYHPKGLDIFDFYGAMTGYTLKESIKELSRFC
jgi:hypothetical protein